MVRALLFDLDNTLYSEASELEAGVARRINEFVADMFNIPFPDVVKFRHEHTRPYGTTLEWLMREEGFKDTEGYFRYIHPDNEVDCLDPDPVLRLMLSQIQLPKAVLTNAPYEHADRVLKKLGISDCFEAVYDIRFNHLVGKPAPDAYRQTLKAAGFALKETLFVDDHPKYVKGYTNLGGVAVLKDELGRFPDFPGNKITTIYEIADLLEKIE